MVPSGVTVSQTQERKAAHAASGMMAMMTCIIAVRCGVDGVGFNTRRSAGCEQAHPRLGFARSRPGKRIDPDQGGVAVPIRSGKNARRYHAATGAWWPFNRADRTTREAAAEGPVQIVRASRKDEGWVGGEGGRGRVAVPLLEALAQGRECR
jgi:hypothetical protein